MKKHVLFGVVMMLIVGLTACGQGKETEESKPKGQMNQEKEEPNSQQQKDSKEEEKLDNTETKEPVSSLEINVYYPDEESREMVSTEVEIGQLDARLVWKQLQKVGVVNTDTDVLGIETNEDGETITLDLNERFGNQLRSMGTTGEKEIIDSVVNTYLDAFECNKIKLLENGKILMSGHKEYTDYMEKR